MLHNNACKSKRSFFTSFAKLVGVMGVIDSLSLIKKALDVRPCEFRGLMYR